MADRILVIENGELTEQGTHAELMARAGTYARLFSLQASSYLGELPEVEQADGSPARIA
jgi:ATP-binding cassette subfamily B protein